MSTYFRVTLPGQPPSWNRSYRARTIKVRDRYGQEVLAPSGRPKTTSAMYKLKATEDYQKGVQLTIQARTPSDFRPAGAIIIAYEFLLGRDIDCDNVMKAINDAVARGLEINDTRLLPVTLGKQSGEKSPCVIIHLFDAKHWKTRVVPV